MSFNATRPVWMWVAAVAVGLLGFNSTLCAETISMSGVVFEDANANGVRDQGEPGLAGVLVSNGIEVARTAPDGQYTLEVNTRDSRFVIMTVPSGYQATTEFYAAADSVTATREFGLAFTGGSGEEVLRFVHASDPQVTDPDARQRFEATLADVAALDKPVAFAVVTGDLVHSANEAQFTEVAQAFDQSPLPLYPVIGDHDLDPDSLRVRSYERWFGPTCYSFDKGGVHFVAFNNVAPISADGEWRQYDWLAADIAQASGQVVMLTHFMTSRADLDRYTAMGVDAVFSGHWHANRIRQVDGVTEFNTAPARYAGIDRTPHGFRLVEMDPQSVVGRYRWGGVHDHLRAVSPAAGLAVAEDGGRVQAMVYDTRRTQLEVDYRVLEADQSVAAGALAHRGGWLWQSPASLNLAPGDYNLEIEARSGGVPFASALVDFSVTGSLLPQSVTDSEWSSVRGVAEGTGAAEVVLAAPSQLAWAAYAGGPTGFSSPLVAEGRLFVAHSGASAATGPAGPGLRAFDPTTGLELWDQTTAGDVKGTPAVASGTIVLVTAGGAVQAFNTANGAERWRADLGDPTERFDISSPTIAGGVVYVGGTSRTAAINLADGTIVWERSLATSDFLATVYSAPAVADDVVALGLFSGLYVLDRTTGLTLWSRAALNREHHRSPAIADGVLYAAGDNFGTQRLRAFDLATGAELWAAPVSVGNANSAPAVAGGRCVLGSSHGAIRAFDAATGALVWSQAVGAPLATSHPYAHDTACVSASPVIAGDRVLVGADDGVMRILALEDGAVVESHDFGAPVVATAAVAGNQWWVCTADGTVWGMVTGDPIQTGTATPGSPPAPALGLGRAQPNPFRSSAQVAFALDPNRPAELAVFDVTGRQVKQLALQHSGNGDGIAAWDGRDARGRRVAAGVYYLRLTQGGLERHRRLAVVR